MLKFSRRGGAPPAETETQISRTFRSPALRAGLLSNFLDIKTTRAIWFAEILKKLKYSYDMGK